MTITTVGIDLAKNVTVLIKMVELFWLSLKYRVLHFLS